MAASSSGSPNPNPIRERSRVSRDDQVGGKLQDDPKDNSSIDRDGWHHVSYKKKISPKVPAPAVRIGGKQQDIPKGNSFTDRDGWHQPPLVSAPAVRVGKVNRNFLSHRDHVNSRRREGSQRFLTSNPRTLMDHGEACGGLGQRSVDFLKEMTNPVFNSQPKSWSSIVSNSIQNKEETKLEFFQPNPDDSITIPSDEIKSNADNWNHTILLYVVGRRPFFVHLKAYIKRMWSPSKEVKVFSRENGFFLVKFDSAEDCDRILDRGPWMFDGRLIIMRKWSVDLCLEKDLLTHIPVWIRLPQLEMKFWSKQCISRIASSLGNPIRMDYATASCSRISFARVLVEISAQQPLKDSIKITCDNGMQFDQPVEYEWVPPCCSRCKFFGHSIKQCPLEEMHGKEKRGEEYVDISSSNHKDLNVEEGTSELGGGSSVIEVDNISSTDKNITDTNREENLSEVENLGEHQTSEDEDDTVDPDSNMNEDDTEDPILQSISANDRRLLSQVIPNWKDVIKLKDQAKEQGKKKKTQLMREDDGKGNRRELRSTKK